MGDMFSVTIPWQGSLAPSGDGRDGGAGSEPFRVAKRGPGRDVGPQPSLGGATPLWGQPCPHPSRHSLDVTIVEGAVVLHLWRESLSKGMQGTRDSPAATAKSRSQVGSEHPRPQTSAGGGPHQVKVTVVAEVVAQRVLGDVVALAAHQLPVHLGEERRGKDTCGEGGTQGGRPRWWDPPHPNLGTPLSPTHLPRRGRAGPSQRPPSGC